MGWDHNEKVCISSCLVFSYKSFVQVDKHESQAKQADYKAGFAGHGDREDVVGPVGTNYVKTKPDSELSPLPDSCFIFKFQFLLEMPQI